MRLIDILREATGYNPHGFDVLLPYIERGLNVKVNGHLDSGTTSDVFKLSDGRLLKITSSADDADGLYTAMMNQFGLIGTKLPIIPVYAVYRVSTGELKRRFPKSVVIGRSKDNIFIAILAEATKVGSADIDVQADLEDELTRYGFRPDDVHSDNVGWYDKRWVLIDPSFRTDFNNTGKIKELKLDFTGV